MKNPENQMKREQKELVRLRKQTGKKNYAGYMFVLCVIIVMIHIADEITTNINTYIQSSVVMEFIGRPQGLALPDALAQFTGITVVFSIISILAPFYKALADVIGRKFFICFNVLGMSIGLALCWWSPNLIIYAIGLALCTFFIQHDMQVVYIYEVAPAEKRATIYGITKCLGTLGLVLVPWFRDIFMKNDDTQWRNVFAIPVIIAVAVALIAFFFVKESGVYVNARIKQLETPIEERSSQRSADKKVAKQNKAGAIHALGYIFKHKQLRWLAVAAGVYGIASYSMNRYVESIMTDYGMSTQSVTSALFVFPFVYAVIIFICGFIGDKKGRKAVALITASMALVGFVCFNIFARLGFNPYVVGLCYGIYLGGFWTAGDYMNMMATELAPTEIRSSVVGGFGILVIFSGLFGLISSTVALLVADSVGLACLICAVPPIVAGIIILLTKVKETKASNLETVGNEE